MIIFFYDIYAGLPHGQVSQVNQVKSGKTKKNDKSQVKMGVFEKKSGKFEKSQVSLTKFEKILDFVSSILQFS